MIRWTAIAFAGSMALSFMMASAITGGWFIGQKMDALFEYATGTEIPDETSLFGFIMAALAIYATTFRQSIQDPVKVPQAVAEAKKL